MVLDLNGGDCPRERDPSDDIKSNARSFFSNYVQVPPLFCSFPRERKPGKCSTTSTLQTPGSTPLCIGPHPTAKITLHSFQIACLFREWAARTYLSRKRMASETKKFEITANSIESPLWMPQFRRRTARARKMWSRCRNGLWLRQGEIMATRTHLRMTSTDFPTESLEWKKIMK